MPAGVGESAGRQTSSLSGTACRGRPGPRPWRSRSRFARATTRASRTCLRAIRRGRVLPAPRSRPRCSSSTTLTTTEPSRRGARAGAGCVREPVAGLDVARNRAVREPRHVVAFVDDDVVVDRRGCARSSAPSPPTPTRRRHRRRAGLALDTPARPTSSGAVASSRDGGAGPLDPHGRRVTVRPVDRRRLQHGVPPSPLAAAGPFDEALDTGPPLPGGGDLDMLIRAAMAGPVRYEPSALVRHEHRATWAQLRRQYRSWGELGRRAAQVVPCVEPPIVALSVGRPPAIRYTATTSSSAPQGRRCRRARGPAARSASSWGRRSPTHARSDGWAAPARPAEPARLSVLRPSRRTRRWERT